MTNIFPIRDVIEKLFSDAIEQRKEDIQQNSDVAHSLATFQKYGNDRCLQFRTQEELILEEEGFSQAFWQL